jgi:putative tricarboxylic transport membrane protein
LILFGLIGYFMKKFQFEGAPLIFALVLGPLFEKSLRQSLLISNGSFKIFVARPISATLLSIALILILSAAIFKRRPEIKEEEDI